MTFQRPPPYHSQWGSLEASCARIVQGTDPAAHADWAGEGFASAEDYRLWSDNTCGVACIQSIIAAAGRDLPPKAQLIAELVDAGAYRRAGDTITGLVYDPCVRWMAQHWGLAGTTERHLTTDDVRRHVRAGAFAITSVAKEIRWPARRAVRRGGHLVLVYDANSTTLTFHNPSGLPAAGARAQSARSAVLGVERFSEFFAERAMVFHPPR